MILEPIGELNFKGDCRNRLEGVLAVEGNKMDCIITMNGNKMADSDPDYLCFLADENPGNTPRRAITNDEVARMLRDGARQVGKGSNLLMAYVKRCSSFSIWFFILRFPEIPSSACLPLHLPPCHPAYPVHPCLIVF